MEDFLKMQAQRIILYFVLMTLLISCQDSIDEREYFDIDGHKISKNEFLKNGCNGIVKSQVTGLTGKKFVEEIEFRNDVKHGVWLLKNQSGKKIETGYYQKGLKHGPEIWWHENGTKFMEMNYKYDKLEGKKIEYYKNGKVAEENNFKNDLRHGKRLAYDINGELLLEEIYEEGKLVKKIK